MKPSTLLKTSYLLIFSLFLFLGCGLSQKDLDDADKRLKVLQEQGAPDSLLSSVKVFLFQVKAAKKSGNSGLLRKNGDSLIFYLEKAEKDFEAALTKEKPYVESFRKKAEETKKELTGLQLKYADSVLSVIDGFIAKNWILAARDVCFRLDTLFPHLLNDEKLARKISKKILGTWVSVRVPEGGFKAKEKRIFTFKSNGTFRGSEEMKGQTAENLKEDWKFISSGTWKMRGDTAMMYVAKEKCARQIFTNLQIKGGKRKWVKNVMPTYDSTLAPGTKDRFLTYEYLTDFFTKKKKK